MTVTDAELLQVSTCYMYNVHDDVRDVRTVCFYYTYMHKKVAARSFIITWLLS